MAVIVRQPRSLPSFAYQGMAEGARFENSSAPETIGPDLLSSVHSQSLTDESAADETLNRPDRT